jgi:hypothetical protein
MLRYCGSVIDNDRDHRVIHQQHFEWAMALLVKELLAGFDVEKVECTIPTQPTSRASNFGVEGLKETTETKVLSFFQHGGFVTGE